MKRKGTLLRRFYEAPLRFTPHLTEHSLLNNFQNRFLLDTVHVLMPSRRRLVRLCSESLIRVVLSPFVRAAWRPVLLNPEAMPTSGPCFFYGNHSNMLDPFILNQFTQWGHATAGVVTQERMRKGLTAWCFKGMGLLPTQKRITEPHLIRGIYRLLDEGRPVVIYPEGGQRWDGRPMPWIETTAKLFIKSGVPVYPVQTHGSYLGWPRWASYPRPARIQVEIMPPLTFEPRTPLEDALDRLKTPIAAYDDAVAPETTRPRRAFHPAAGIHRLLYRDPDTGENGGLSTPDGTHVVNPNGTRRLRMLPDSTLRDEHTGETYRTGDLYAQIRSLPLEKDADGAFVRNRVALHTETAFPNLILHGIVEAALHDDAVRLNSPIVRRTLPLETLQYADIERNYKLQLRLADEMVQLSFTQDGSALHWLDTLHRLL